MHMLTKEQIEQNANPAAAPAWVLAPAVAEAADLEETRLALKQAEAVMHAQEERIRQLEQLALTDELTGLANRRGFIAAFERELALARRDSDYGGILVMIDLDGFKDINDNWGHQAGDAYLKTVAQALRDGVRASDTVARLGGDEFALLFSRMNQDNGAKRLARLEESFGRRAAMLHERVPLRASFGFAPYAGGDAADAVMRSADLRLYANKARNKTLIAAG